MRQVVVGKDVKPEIGMRVMVSIESGLAWPEAGLSPKAEALNSLLIPHPFSLNPHP